MYHINGFCQMMNKYYYYTCYKLYCHVVCTIMIVLDWLTSLVRGYCLDWQVLFCGEQRVPRKDEFVWCTKSNVMTHDFPRTSGPSLTHCAPRAGSTTCPTCREDSFMSLPYGHDRSECVDYSCDYSLITVRALWLRIVPQGVGYTGVAREERGLPKMYVSAENLGGKLVGK